MGLCRCDDEQKKLAESMPDDERIADAWKDANDYQSFAAAEANLFHRYVRRAARNTTNRARSSEPNAADGFRPVATARKSI